MVLGFLNSFIRITTSRKVQRIELQKFANHLFSMQNKKLCLAFGNRVTLTFNLSTCA